MAIWGSGEPRREFLHVDDCADALVHIMKRYSGSGHLNLGYGEDVSVNELARLVADVIGFKGDFVHDMSRPDGNAVSDSCNPTPEKFPTQKVGE